MLNYLVYLLIVIFTLLVTFFGLGPVLLADGSLAERMITLVIVLAVYVGLGIFLKLWIKKNRQN